MDNNTNNNDNSNMTNNQENSAITSDMLSSIKIPVDTSNANTGTESTSNDGNDSLASIPVPTMSASKTAEDIPASGEISTIPVVNSTSIATSVVSTLDTNSNPAFNDLDFDNNTSSSPNTAPVNIAVANTGNPSASEAFSNNKLEFCPRCGAEFNPKERYCKKCGNINAKHPDNANMTKYIKKYGGTGYRIGSGQALVRKKGVFGRGKSSDIVIGQRTGNASLCFAVNMVLYLVLTIGTTLYYLLLARGNFLSVISSNITLYYLVYSALFLYVYSLQLLFIKLNRRWWLSLIPIVNFLVLVEAVNDSKKLMLLALVPGINVVVLILTLYRLGTSFKISGYLTVFFPFITIPVIAFGGSSFHWLYFVSNNSTIEKDYRYKSVFRTALITFVVVSIAFDLYTQNVMLVHEAGRMDKAYIYNASHIFADDVIKKVEAGNFSCDFNMDDFYFYFKDLSDEYTLPFSVFFEPVEGYVRVEKVKEDGIVVLNEYNYYISVSDGKYGFMEIPTKNLSVNSVVRFERVLPIYDNGNHCYLANKKS